MASASLDDLAAKADRLVGGYGPVGPEPYHATGIPGLGVVRSTETSSFEPTIYRSVVCLILQGAKEVDHGERRADCSEGTSIIVSHELPLDSRITRASSSVPYLAVVLDVDVDILRSLVADATAGAAGAAGAADGGSVEAGAGGGLGPGAAVAPGAAVGGLDVGLVDDGLLDAFARLIDLADQPRHAPVLAPLVVREIHYRLLHAGNGAGLRQLLHGESHASRIFAAITRIREELAQPLAVPDLARSTGMSPSSFHEHFKAVTATTPLQYQKELRLFEARRLLGEGTTVTDTALAVGYRSPTQFSREYSRKFGVSPRSDRGRHVVAS
ncbi:MAG: AraC family transcriptional regulator [Actinomycetota bacterium]